MLCQKCSTILIEMGNDNISYIEWGDGAMDPNHYF